jgi:hypothetical protein
VIQTVLNEDNGRNHFRALPLDRERSDQLWISEAFQVGPEQLNEICLLPANPLEELVQVLRTSASAQPSPVMSEVEEFGQEQDHG